ncbi:meiotically up-regulated gene 113-domain-containing protein [Camillea tinctor]|nr:meiotically up-regulated gene 113-domain-containing protein [Camillea tinctor]
MTFMLARVAWSETSNTLRNNLRGKQVDILRCHNDGIQRPFYGKFINNVIAKYIPNSVPFKQYHHEIRGPSPSKSGQTYRNAPRQNARPQQRSGIAIKSTVEQSRPASPFLQTRGLETISSPASSPFPPYLAPLKRAATPALNLVYPKQEVSLSPLPVVLPAIYPVPVNHEFKYINKREKTSYHINYAVQQKLLEPIPDKKQGVGSLYAFRFPDEHRINGGSSQGYIKIGRSKKPAARMGEIERKCQYTPQLVIARPMVNYRQLEQIVHLMLGNERMREAGKCPGCGKHHNEWFEVETDRAKTLIEAWERWAARQPYDGTGGSLLEEWRQEVEKVDLTDPRCWDKFLENW